MEHFLEGEESEAIRFRHVDWAVERPKLLDVLKALAARPGEGLIFWRENKPYIVAGGYIVEAALRLDALAKEAEGRGQKLTANDIETAVNQHLDNLTEAINAQLEEILSRREEIEEETEINPYNDEDYFREALDFGRTAKEISTVDFTILLQELCRLHPRIATHIDKERRRRRLYGE